MLFLFLKSLPPAQVPFQQNQQDFLSEFELKRLAFETVLEEPSRGERCSLQIYDHTVEFYNQAVAQFNDQQFEKAKVSAEATKRGLRLLAARLSPPFFIDQLTELSEALETLFQEGKKVDQQQKNEIARLKKANEMQSNMVNDYNEIVLLFKEGIDLWNQGNVKGKNKLDTAFLEVQRFALKYKSLTNNQAKNLRKNLTNQMDEIQKAISPTPQPKKRPKLQPHPTHSTKK